MTTKLQRVFEQIDAINSQDPHLEDGQPKELLYSQRMTAILEKFSANPSELLRIAARGQHIKRWAIPREEYPMDRKGYLKWRTQLKILHGDLMGAIMKDCGYSGPDIAHVKDLLMKKNIKSDPEAQTLEDVVCLVFLQYYLDDFMATKTEDKMIDILKKTWNKMSEDGHRAAKELQLSGNASHLISLALTP